MTTIERDADKIELTPVEVEIENPPVLTVTPLAVQTVKSLLEEKQLTGHALRVFVAGGGCSGMQYGMALEEAAAADDAVVECGPVTVLVDPASAPMLSGVTVDFVDSIEGSGFKFNNPNATASCGCGNSFSA